MLASSLFLPTGSFPPQLLEAIIQRAFVHFLVIIVDYNSFLLSSLILSPTLLRIHSKMASSE